MKAKELGEWALLGKGMWKDYEVIRKHKGLQTSINSQFRQVLIVRLK